MTRRLQFIVSADAPWGAEHSLRILARELANLDHEVEVVCQSDKIEAFFASVPRTVVRVVPRAKNRVEAAYRLYRASLATQPRSVIVCSLDLLPLVPVLRWVGRSTVTVDLHDYPQQAHVRGIVWFFTRLAHRTIAISKFSARLGPLGRTRVVRRPFEQNRQPLGPRSTSELRVAVVGRMDSDKGHQLALDALLHCDEAISLVFVGAPSVGEELYAEGLLDAAATFGIRFEHRRSVPSTEVFRGVDVLLVTNHREAAGRTVVEAMIAGVPVVVPDEGGAAEYVQPGVTGWTYHAGDPISLAATLAAVRDAEPEKLSRMLLAAQEYARQFAPHLIGQQYADALPNDRRHQGEEES